MKLSVIILNWNTKNLISNCLDSLLKDINRNVEIIVVDNASTDGSVEMLGKKYKEINLIKNTTNLGFALGNNEAIKKTHGEYILFLNSDTIVQAGTLEKLINFLDINSDVGAVSPLIFNQDGTRQDNPCYLKLPSVITCFLYYNKLLRKFTLHFFPGLLLSTTDFSKEQQVEQLPGAAMVVRKKLIDSIGAFDGRFPIYFEDSDLSYRIRKDGYKLMVVPGTYITHIGRKSIEPVVKVEGINEFYNLNFKSLFLFCDKNYPTIKTLFIKLVIYGHLLSTFKLGLIYRLIKPGNK